MESPSRILMVCLGNICRSPMAECLFHHKLVERGLDGRIEVDSAGTGSWHVGEAPDPRTQSVLREHGIAVRGRARTVTAQDFGAFDVLLAMDTSNVTNLGRVAPEGGLSRVHKVLAPVDDGDVPDPYYDDDGFEKVYRMLDRALDAWLDRWTA